MRYTPESLPHQTRRLPDGTWLVVSASGDHAFLPHEEVSALRHSPAALSLERQAELKSKFFLRSRGQADRGVARLLASRRAAKQSTAIGGPSLNIIVPTLQCAHSCKYCQVSRALDDDKHVMDLESMAKAGRTIFESSADAITVEYQGGDPLLRFDLVRRSIEQISELNREKRRRMRFVVASTLHQLTPKMCEFLKEHKVYLSTSLDGPKELHNKNRPSPTRDSYERTIAGIELARAELGQDSVSALMTTTRASLKCPEAIVDEYVRLGFQEIFIRPLSYYGFAKRNQLFLAYSQEDFQQFYEKALERVLDWNAKGVAIREVYASIILNKMLGTFDAGYVDLQPPSDTGRGALVFNYDGYVYPSDEARMLAETGDSSFRMGRIGESIESLLSSEAHQGMCRAVSDEYLTGCADCTYRTFCGPNAVDAFAQSGSMSAPVQTTQHCARQLWMFDMLYCKLRTAPEWMQDLFSRWAQHNEVSA